MITHAVPNDSDPWKRRAARPQTATEVRSGTVESCRRARGLLFALGLLTPLAAAGLIGLMVVTILVDHRFNGFFVFRKGEGVEYVTVLAVAAASIAAIGPGTASLDHAFGWDERNGWTSLAIAVGIGVGAAVLQVALFWRNPRKVPST